MGPDEAPDPAADPARTQAMPLRTTIAAVSTPAGPGGIAIVRVSGPRAEKVGRTVFTPQKIKHPLPSHRMVLGYVKDPDTGKIVDQVMCCLMKAPHSYTREDVLEIHCHGGQVLAAGILEIVLKFGAEPAEPGEFTRRAFMAGRIDLSQAEAVAELIGARSRAEAELAAAQLDGGLGRRVEGMRAVLIEILAHIEAALDFPDEDIDPDGGWIDADGFAAMIRREVIDKTDELIAAYENGRVFREGVTVVIAGRPNVGKSSLLNALVGQERAIVAQHPGTTRDVIEVEAVFYGVPVVLADTAGLESEAADEVEAEGKKRALKRLHEADIVLAVVEQGRELTEADRRIVGRALDGRTMVVVNKVDLAEAFTMGEAGAFLGRMPCVGVSARFGNGLEELKRVIVTAATGRDVRERPSGMMPNVRHKNALALSLEPLRRVVEGMEKGLAPELIALEIRESLGHMGVITGETTPDDVLDEIFKSFCLGK